MATVSLAGRDVTVSTFSALAATTPPTSPSRATARKPSRWFSPTSALLADGGQIELPVYSQDVQP